jgi:hypothetical protein
MSHISRHNKFKYQRTTAYTDSRIKASLLTLVEDDGETGRLSTTSSISPYPTSAAKPWRIAASLITFSHTQNLKDINIYKNLGKKKYTYHYSPILMLTKLIAVAINLNIACL